MPRWLEREREGGGGRRVEKGSDEMVWILRIFGFYAFWVLLWRAPSFSLVHRTTDVCGYNGDYVRLAESSLSPKVLSGCCWKAIYVELIHGKYTFPLTLSIVLRVSANIFALWLSNRSWVNQAFNLFLKIQVYREDIIIPIITYIIILAVY